MRPTFFLIITRLIPGYLRIWFKGLVHLTFPFGIIAPNQEYEAGITDARITVRVSRYFTVINVNGLDIYFEKLTGKIDGVGMATGCKADSSGLSFPAPLESSESEKAP